MEFSVRRNEKRETISYYTQVRNKRISPHLTGASELIRLFDTEILGNNQINSMDK